MSGATTATTIAGMVVAAAGTAASMYASYEQNKQQTKAVNAQAEYNAQVAENERAQQEQLAQNEVQKGISERERQMRQASRQQGEATSSLAASGFEIDSGSNLSLLGESAEEAQYDANIITQNANMAAWQHQAGAQAANNQKSMIAYQKEASKPSGTATALAMGGTLLGGIGTGLAQYNAYQKTAGAKTSTGGFYDPALQAMVPKPVRH